MIAIENCVDLCTTFSIRSQAKENKVLPSSSLSPSCCYLVGSEWKLCSLEQIGGRVTMMELYCYDYITVVLQRAIPALNKIGYLSYVYGYMCTLLQFHCICIVSQKNIQISIYICLLCPTFYVVMLQHSTKMNDN